MLLSSRCPKIKVALRDGNSNAKIPELKHNPHEIDIRSCLSIYNETNVCCVYYSGYYYYIVHDNCTVEHLHFLM